VVPVQVVPPMLGAVVLIIRRSWVRATLQTVRSESSEAELRGTRAGSASDAWGRSSHNPPVVGSSPTRPTHRATEAVIVQLAS